MESATGLASDGISVAALRSFYENHVEGKTYPNCTCADILPVVKMLTKAKYGRGGFSYCELLRRQAASSPSLPSEFGPATVYISYAWKYNFHEYLVALECKFKDQPLVRLWIDLFCHNQHEELSSDEWITKFEQLIVRINNTVAIVIPWDNSIIFSRFQAKITFST